MGVPRNPEVMSADSEGFHSGLRSVLYNCFSLQQCCQYKACSPSRSLGSHRTECTEPGLFHSLTTGAQIMGEQITLGLHTLTWVQVTTAGKGDPFPLCRDGQARSGLADPHPHSSTAGGCADSRLLCEAVPRPLTHSSPGHTVLSPAPKPGAVAGPAEPPLMAPLPSVTRCMGATSLFLLGRSSCPSGGPRDLSDIQRQIKVYWGPGKAQYWRPPPRTCTHRHTDACT